MDIGELLAFKPEQTPKRPHEDEDDDFNLEAAHGKRGGGDEKTKRMRRIAEAKESAHYSKQAGASGGSSAATGTSAFEFDPELTEEERLNILKYVENEEADGDVLDEQSLKKLILVFEKRNLKNQEMRIKFADSPEKFMDSEVELHTVIQELKGVATVPDLYPLLVELHGLHSLLELLAHQNTDIAVAVVDLLQEVTDVDILGESQEGAESLIEALRKEQICALLVQNLERLNEQVKEEADGVHNTLAIVENLTEIDAEFVKEAAEQGLLAWLLKRLRGKSPFDPNKLYCSEILSILIQTENDNRLLLGSLDGVDVLLQQLAVYKRHDPASNEEQEYMQNLFNCLCSALMARENRDRFLSGEGLQLMNLMLREKKMSRNGSLKVLDHAMAGQDGRDNCNKFVEILGLRTIFPLFMKTPKRNKQRLISADEHEEHVTSVIASMLRNCKGTHRQRMLAKFTENDHEKVDRLLELHLKYLAKVEAIDKEIDQQAKDPSIDEDEEAENNYIKRLTGGLFTLQRIDYILLEVSATGDTVKQRVLQILNLRGASMKTIRSIMREYAGNLGDGDTDWREQEQTHILSLVDRF
ncbi:beta-catenin-like protein 1 isoform X1 [Drosophila biarmipes]|uniref:beta-catenin-like protein 1 isoform X2 n=1 Tax=Drosophila biarmipes TaxID=125945 RepID=UPI0007E74002|nr:beta-catenin-like protein 1 isoform X2 [Drosophila biarmipes]XP_050745422.1 beta-catenin-like protein 1 isoform X1 [Drosophila biarmipes]